QSFRSDELHSGEGLCRVSFCDSSFNAQPSRGRLLSDKAADAPGDLVSNCTKDGESLPGCSRSFRGVIKWPMLANTGAGENRAVLLCVVTDGDYKRKMLTHVFTHVLRSVTRDVDTGLAHHLYGHRIHRRRLC